MLTLVRDRDAHLLQLVEGLRRGIEAPGELIVVNMGERPLPSLSADFPIRVETLIHSDLPLAAARNRAAALAGSEALVFLDVDCIPMAACLRRLRHALIDHDGLLCAEALYLGPEDARGAWTEIQLKRAGQRHPARVFPASGVAPAPHPGLFWSLAFAVRRTSFETLGGFDEGYVGYGGEDTDLGFRAAACDLPILFVGGTYVCHQHHASHEPPVQHLEAIVHNACRFRARWGQWPMGGWLSAFADMGLVAWDDDRLTILRSATAEERRATRIAADATFT